MSAWWVRWWAPWGALLRRARRLAWRSPLRTAWTGLLVLVAVAVAGTVMSAIWGSNSTSASADRAMGTADVIYSATSTADVASSVPNALLAQMPVDSKAAVEQTIPGLVLMATGEAATSDPEGVGGVYADVRMADWDDPLLHGVLGLVEGRAPREGEIVVSPDVAESLHLNVGDRLTVDSSAGSLVVSGVATIGAGGSPTAAVATGELVPGSSTEPTPEVHLTAFVGLPSGAVAPSGEALTRSHEQLNVLEIWGPLGRPGDPAPAQGATLISPSRSRPEAVVLMTIAAVAVVGLLVGASSGIGARRRQRASGLLAANGADGGQLAVAVAAEVVVVAVPAALLGLLVCWAGVTWWVDLRLQGWPAFVDAAFGWVWVAPLVVGSVTAAGVGAVLLSRDIRGTTPSALLDSRGWVSRRTGGRRSLGWLGWIVVGLVVWTTASYIFGGVSVGGGLSGRVSALALFVLWLASGSVALRLTSVFLGRNLIGRVVERDLRHRRLGSVATILVVATWVFVAVMGTFTDSFGSTYQNDQSQPVVETTSGAAEATSSGAGLTAGELSDPSPGTSLLIQSGNVSGAGKAPGTWQLRDPDPDSGPARRIEPLPGSLAAELDRAGLVTSSATVAEWTGACAVCPDGFTPTVLVLESTAGVGLSPATAELLQAGNAVTPFDMAGIEDEDVAGVPVRVGSVPSGVQAVVMSSSVIGSTELADRRSALVGSTAGLTDDQIRQILWLADSEGASVSFGEPRLDMLRSDLAQGAVVVTDARPWLLWPSVVVLLVVALAATAAHRREHGDAARVLKVLGARPRAARRMASLTAGTLTGTGVVLGLTTALMLLTFVMMRRGEGDPSLWTRDTVLVLAVSLALPIAVAQLARLIPPYRAVDGPDGPAPV